MLGKLNIVLRAVGREGVAVPDLRLTEPREFTRPSSLTSPFRRAPSSRSTLGPIDGYVLDSIEEQTTVISIAVTGALHDRDDNEYIWTYRDKAPDPSLNQGRRHRHPGCVRCPAVAKVVDVTESPAGAIVNLRLLPGTIDDYIQLA